MSQANVELVRRASETFNRGDLDAWEECYTPDVVYYDSSNLDTPSVVRGREQLRQALQEFMTGLEDFRAEIVELIDAGERVLAVTIWRGTGQASRVAVELQEFLVFALRDGKIYEGRAFADRAEALRAAGLQE